MLNRIIFKARQGNQNSAEELIKRFNPIIQKYAYLLHEEDAVSELQLFLLELIYKIPNSLLQKENNGQLTNYIKTAMSNRYKQLVTNKINNKFIIPISCYSQEEQQSIFNTVSHIDEMDSEILDLIEKLLTPNEVSILLLRYWAQYTIQDIAKYKNISRQAVNQMHVKAINKLKKFLIN